MRGRVSSPTFIIARVHPALSDGPDLIHVDAYRITSLEEIDALDLDSSLERAVTLVEWGEEKRTPPPGRSLPPARWSGSRSWTLARSTTATGRSSCAPSVRAGPTST